MRRSLLAAALVLVAAAATIIATRTRNSPSDVELSRTFDDSPTGITLRYPDNWKYQIPMQGLMVLGMPETLEDNQPGPTFTVQRNAPISVYGSLEEALDLYLRRGPLRPDRHWITLGEITPATFLGREALVVDLQGAENEISPELRAHIVATPAQNTFVYILVLTAPASEWDAYRPTLQAMLDSVEILE